MWTKHVPDYCLSMTDILFINPNQILYMLISCLNCLILHSNNRLYALKQTCKFTYRPILQKELFLAQDIKGVKACQVQFPLGYLKTLILKFLPFWVFSPHWQVKYKTSEISPKCYVRKLFNATFQHKHNYIVSMTLQISDQGSRAGGSVW